METMMAFGPIALASLLLKYTNLFQQSITMFLSFIGWQWYAISSTEQTGKLEKLISFSSVKYGSSKSDGYFCGKWFIGYINRHVYNVLMKTKHYEKIIINRVEEELKEKLILPGEILRYSRCGPYSNLEYVRFSYSIKKEPFNFQKHIIDQILDIFDKKSYCVAVIYGSSGSCKSFTGNLLAKELTKKYEQVAFVDSFNPTDPGDTFENIYFATYPNINRPLVVVLEEVDIIINNIHYGNIYPHKHIHIPVRDKTSWNCFLDKFGQEYFKNVIFIMTTNKNMSYFDELDNSYLRDGRVDIKFNIDEIRKKFD